jgi:NADH dehydrogenase
MARIAIQAAASPENITWDVAGQEILSYREMVSLIAKNIDSHTPLLNLPPNLALTLVKFVNVVLRDVLLTHDELRGLMANLLVTTTPPLGITSFSSWLEQNSELLGRQYASELSRHFRT